jgi:hypothetical protein
MDLPSFSSLKRDFLRLNQNVQSKNKKGITLRGLCHQAAMKKNQSHRKRVMRPHQCFFLQSVAMET